jgi:hypothetical protein
MPSSNKEFEVFVRTTLPEERLFETVPEDGALFSEVEKEVSTPRREEVVSFSGRTP